MTKKRELKEAIVDTEQEIEALEKKLFRSQTALLLDIIDGKQPEKKEVEFFKMYANLIEQSRKRLLQETAEYNSDNRKSEEY